VGSGIAVGDWVGLLVGSGVSVFVAVSVGMGVTSVAVAMGVIVSVSVGSGVTVGVSVDVEVGVGTTLTLTGADIVSIAPDASSARTSKTYSPDSSIGTTRDQRLSESTVVEATIEPLSWISSSDSATPLPSS